MDSHPPVDTAPVDTALAAVCRLDECGRRRRADVVARLVARAGSVLPTADGVRLSFAPTRANAEALGAFLRAERECCPDFAYELSPASERHRLDLAITARGDNIAPLQDLYLGSAHARGDTMTSAEQLHIGEVARRAAVRASAIRYYERSGLIHPPRRAAGQRVYDASVFEALALIQLAQDAGFTIRETRMLLNGFDRATPASARWQSLARRKLGEVEDRIARAERMRDVLERLLRCRCETLGECVRKRAGALVRTPKRP